MAYGEVVIELLVGNELVHIPIPGSEDHSTVEILMTIAGAIKSADVVVIENEHIINSRYIVRAYLRG